MITINLENVYRIQYNNGSLIDPVYFMILNDFGLGDTENISCLWKVKGHKTMIMLNTLILIPENKKDANYFVSIP